MQKCNSNIILPKTHEHVSYFICLINKVKNEIWWKLLPGETFSEHLEGNKHCVEFLINSDFILCKMLTVYMIDASNINRIET